MNHYIYLDDIRNDNHWFNVNLGHNEWCFHLCRNMDAVTTLIQAILYSGESASFIMDFDHDLGENEPSGYDICKWVVENQIPLIGFHIHSMNPVGVMNMRQLLTHYGYKEI